MRLLCTIYDLRCTILAPLKTRFLDSGQLMVRILSGIFPTFPPQNLPIFPYFSLFLTPFSSTFFLSFFTLVVFRGARFINNVRVAQIFRIINVCG